jgi:hypothetical protein
MWFILLWYQSLDDKAKREKGWESSMSWNRRELPTGVLVRKAGEKDLCENGGIILKWIFQK